MKKIRKMLSDWEKPHVQALMSTIETQSKHTLASWAINYSKDALLPLYERAYPEDLRPVNALDGAKRWLEGTVKLPQVKPLILKCHEAAREASDYPVAQGVARAIGQSASTIHSPRHCIGLYFYGALALAYNELGVQASRAELDKYEEEECHRMYEALKKLAVINEENPAKISWKC